MPRTARAARAGWCYHVVNRANNRATIFADAPAYLAFLGLIAESQARVELDLLAACLMPNHFHFVLRPRDDQALGRFMHWLLTTHVRRFHARHETSGRLWQGRFKAFPIEQDRHLLAVLRYVERNALRAGLVRRAEDWPWGSLAWRCRRFAGPSLTDSPVPLGRDWTNHVNAVQSHAELEALRASGRQERPFGSPEWTMQAAEDLALTAQPAHRGRPPGARPKENRNVP